MTISIRIIVVSHFSCLRLQFCSYFQWENHKECQTIFTTLSRKDEATHNVRISLPSNISLISFFCHEPTEDTLMLYIWHFSGLSSEGDQVKEDPSIYVADLAGSLSCCFLQVGRTPSSRHTILHLNIFSLDGPQTIDCCCVSVSCVLWLTSCSLLTVLWALLIGLLGKAN